MYHKTISTMVDLKQFRENARLDGLCAEYTEKWDSCQSKKQLMDMCLGVKGLDYICDAVAKGWGISPSILAEKFKNYINGRYVFNNGVYTTKMYCLYDGEINCDTTAVSIIESNANVIVPKNALVEIYLTGKTNITLGGLGRCVLIIYGDNVSYTVDEKTNVRYKVIIKKSKDNYDG
jgi:hypothetical protein